MYLGHFLKLSVIGTSLLALSALMVPVSAQTVLKSGSFKGAGGHSASGRVELIKTGGKVRLVLKGNFRLDGAPDPKIAFGRGGYTRGTIISRLKRLRGGQSYNVPSRIKVANFTEVWLWCQRFNVPLGVARIK